MKASVGDVRAALEAAYPMRWAASWDAVGPVCGADDLPVERVLLTIDPTLAAVDEAVRADAMMIVAHHPLHLRGVHGASPGGVLDACIRQGIALHIVHTNGDVARPGTSDALWSAIGLGGDPDAIEPDPDDTLDLLHVYVPAEARDALIAALAAAGAGRIGDYEECAYATSGTGQFRPLPGANPSTGTVGELTQVAEDRVEMVAPTGLRAQLTAALRAAHPYEEPAFGFTVTHRPHRRGFGRIGDIDPISFGELAWKVESRLPQCVGRVRRGGMELTSAVSRVAVAAGAGDDAIEAAASLGAQVLITSDLRHHRSRDALDLGLALIDVPHWSAEWPWLGELSTVITGATTVETLTSTVSTDPFNTTAQPGAHE